MSLSRRSRTAVLLVALAVAVAGAPAASADTEAPTAPGEVSTPDAPVAPTDAPTLEDPAAPPTDPPSTPEDGAAQDADPDTEPLVPDGVGPDGSVDVPEPMSALSDVTPLAVTSASIVSPLPSQSYRMTSAYGPRCLPIINASTWHLGQDLGAADGTPIYAIAAGTVVRTAVMSSGGHYIQIQHTIDGRTVSSIYSHMWNARQFVQVGQQVSAGQRIASVGSSGVSTSPHLHLEIWSGVAYGGGSHVDPDAWLNARGVSLRAGATAVTQQPPPATCTYRSTTTLNIRSGAGTSSPIVTTVPAGTELTPPPGTDKTNNFLRIRLGEATAWASAAYVTPAAVAPTPAHTTSAIPLRSGPSPAHSIVYQLPAGTRIRAIHAHQGHWLRITTWGGRVGWVSGHHVADGPTPQARTSAQVPLRAGPAATYAQVYPLPENTRIRRVHSRSGHFYLVTTWGGRAGWVSDRLLERYVNR